MTADGASMAPLSCQGEGFQSKHRSDCLLITAVPLGSSAFRLDLPTAVRPSTLSVDPSRAETTSVYLDSNVSTVACIAYD